MQLDPGDDFLAIALVGDADHLHVGHRRVSEEELLQFARIDVLAAADDHVLAAPDDPHVAVVVHHRQVAGVHPARRVDGLGGGLGVVPVAEHHAVAAGAQLADLAARHHPARLVDDLALQPRLGASDSGHAQLQAIVRTGLQRHRTGLGHAVGDLHLGHVHVANDPPHHLDRAGGAGHDSGAQAGKVEFAAARMIQLGDEHGRYPVQRGGALLGHGQQGRLGVEAGRRVDHGRAVGDAAEVAHHHAEAVIQRHRDHQAVFRAESEAFADHVAVVEDVVVAEGGALGEAGGTGGVLDVDRLVELQRGLALAQFLGAYRGGQPRQALPVQEARRRPLGQADHAAQFRQALAGQFARTRPRQLRQQVAEHRVVVAGLEGVGADQPTATGLLESVFQLAAAVCRVDVHQDRTDLGAGELGNAPFGAVRRPDPQAFAGAQAQRDEGAGVGIDPLRQLPPAVAQALMPHHQRLALGMTRDGGIEGVADGGRQQGDILATRGIARLIHGFPLLWLFWECR